MKFKTFFSTFIFIFLILNQDIIISAYQKSQEVSAIRTLASRTSKVKKGLLKSKLGHQKDKTNSSSERKNELSTAVAYRHKTRFLETLCIIAIVLIVSVIILSATKRVVDKLIEKELKKLSSEVNKQKVAVFMERKAENALFIEYCLEYQKMSKLFKSYAIMAELTNKSLQESLAEAKATDPDISSTKDKAISAKLQALSSVKFTDLLHKIEDELDKSVLQNCFNSHKLRAEWKNEDLLGDYYTGFTESEFKEIDSGMKANEDTWKEIAGETAGETIKELAEGAAESIETVITLNNPSEANKREEAFVILKGAEDLKWLEYFKGSIEVVSSGVKLKDNINEIIKYAKESDTDSMFKKIMKYVLMGLSVIDNLIKGISSIITLAGGPTFSFPFLEVIDGTKNFVESLLEYNNAKKEYNEDTTNPKKPNLELIKEFKKWDMFDAGFELLNQISDVVTTLAAPVVGVSKIVGLSIKAFVSTTSLIFAITKLRKIRALKSKIVDYLQKQTDEFTKESEKMRKQLKSDRCAQYSVILKNLLEAEVHDLTNAVIHKKSNLKAITSDLTVPEKQRLETEILATNKNIVRTICEKDVDFCPDFLESLTVDKTFINTDESLKTLLLKVGNLNAMGPANSLISVYKGIPGEKGFSQADKSYVQDLIVNLIENDYDPVFSSPRYDVYLCRACGNQKLYLSSIENFLTNKEIKVHLLDTDNLIAADQKKFNYIQETIQFANVLDNKDELSEYLVGIYSNSAELDKFNEFSFADPTFETTKWFFWTTKALKPTMANFRIPIVLNKKPNLFETFDTFLVFSIGEKAIGQAIRKLNKNINVNIVSIKIYRTRQSENPSHFFILALTTARVAKSVIFQICGSLPPETCKTNKMDYKIDKSKLAYANKYTIVVNDSEGVDETLLIQNKWFVESSSMTFRISEKESVKVTLMSKRILQFQGFVKPTDPNNLSILTQLDENKDDTMGKMLGQLSSTICKDCPEMAPFISKYF